MKTTYLTSLIPLIVITWRISFKLDPVQKLLVSSAKRMNLSTFEELHISFIYMYSINYFGPKNWTLGNPTHNLL